MRYDRGDMRSLWDHETPLSPATLRSAVGLFTWMAAGLVALNVLGALGALFRGQIWTAMVWLLSGTLVPFAVWLAVRMLADLLILQNRTADSLSRVLEQVEPPPVSTPRAPDPVRPEL